MKTVQDLRAALFDTLDELRAGRMTVEQAKAVSEVAQTIINTAKVEVDYCRVTEQRSGSGFLPDEPQQVPRKLPRAV